jgi:folylpolyglutamate synthase/dihydropteroate synthase
MMLKRWQRIRQQHGSKQRKPGSGDRACPSSGRAEDLVLITGSLYVVGDARAVFQGPDSDAPALKGLKG